MLKKRLMHPINVVLLVTSLRLRCYYIIYNISIYFNTSNICIRSIHKITSRSKAIHCYATLQDIVIRIFYFIYFLNPKTSMNSFKTNIPCIHRLGQVLMYFIYFSAKNSNQLMCLNKNSTNLAKV